ncbi:MAG TPA: hypothetical protein ENH95_02270 [Nitrosopumilus sp.]|nr:hypothetical protein [Nitrosopumilus sp.]
MSLKLEDKDLFERAVVFNNHLIDAKFDVEDRRKIALFLKEICDQEIDMVVKRFADSMQKIQAEIKKSKQEKQ